MIPGWLEKIDAAQRQTTMRIDGQDLHRQAYGSEWAGMASHCRDCAVAIGELHVPGCCVERCPACGLQAISCDCNDED